MNSASRVTYEYNKMIKKKYFCKQIKNCEIFFFSCAPAWEDPDSFYYTLYLFILGFFIPVIIIVICNVGVIFVMKQVNHH